MNSENKKESVKRYQYRDCGLDNVWIEGGFEEIESPYGPGIAIHDLDGLHRCIASCLLTKHGFLTGAEFRFLRTELDLSQPIMGDLCGRGERTVRDWESRDELVDEPANTIIRFVYEQRHNPSANYEGLSRKIKQLQARDKEFHELKLRRTAEGWKADQCSEAA